jgi:hypothetical protein
MNKRQILWIMAFVLVLLVFVIVPLSNAANIIGNNYKNVTVRTSLNISNSKPDILAIKVYQETNGSLLNITLNAGFTRTITCNVTVRDWNTYTDISVVNGTLFQTVTSSFAAADDNNTHYTNTSCSGPFNASGYFADYVCGFDVLYYANNATWNCTVIAKDNYNATGNNTNSTYIYPLYALNVTDGMAFGSVAVEEYSGNITANVTNFGNRAINVTVEGYGVTRNDGLAMNCSTGGNITVSNQRFSASDVDWGSKTTLTQNAQLITGLTIPKQTISGTLSQNTTYWQLYVNSSNSPGGNCTGFVIFSAEIS